MNPGLEQLLNFIDSFCLENKLYYKVPYYYTQGSVEITHHFNNHNWVVHFPDVGTTHSIKTPELSGFLSARYVNLVELEAAITQTILTQVCFSQLIIDKANKLFGTDVVADAIAEQVRFSEELVSAVESILRPKPRLIKE